MACAERASRRARARRLAGAAIAALLLGSCADGFEPLSLAEAPLDLRAEAVRLDAVRLRWTPVTQANVVSYVVERRAQFAGEFLEIAQVPQSALGEIVWLDTEVAPETHYGYRVVSVTSVGDRSRPSVVGGALTPPLPGIEISTSTIVTAAEAIDPDGYDVLIAGPDTVRATLGVETKRRFSPLRPGTYTVTLNGLASRCSVVNPSRAVVVTDTLATTIASLAFQVTCRDPNRGEILVSVATTGADLDPSVAIGVLGEASDASLPASERTFSASRVVERSLPTTTFTNVRPGTYDVTISDVAANCAVAGPVTRTVPVVALGVATVSFAVTCAGSTPPLGGNLPFTLRNRWTPATAAPGAVVRLTSELDVSARAGQEVNGVQADYFYDPTVLRYDSIVPRRVPPATVNALAPGKVTVLAATTASGRTGVVALFDIAFTVIGSTGQTVASSTLRSSFRASGRLNGTSVQFADSVRFDEDTLTVGAAGPANQPPVASAGGPYAGAPGVPLTLSATASTDPDGSIVSYAWAFGDNTTGSGATVSHAYATSGTYTATVIVTDDRGAADTAQATVTIASGGGGNVAPVAEANGPYTATVGVPVTLSSAGSMDPNGTIVGYAWTLGNGQTATGAAPSVTYTVAGTYTVTLTVTDNGGLSASDQAIVTVAATTGNTLRWSTAFGAYDAQNDWVPLVLSLDLSANLTETPGPEAIRTFVIDSLRWDPSRLQLVSVNVGPGINASVNQSAASSGRISLAGSVADAQQGGDAFQQLTFVTLRLRPIGASGSTVTTATSLGPIQGPASTGFFAYNGRISVIEGTFTRP